MATIRRETGHFETLAVKPATTWMDFCLRYAANPGAGSIRRKSKSAFSRGNASAPEEFPISRRYAEKAVHGID
jgi:hypothetical protein